MRPRSNSSCLPSSPLPLAPSAFSTTVGAQSDERHAAGGRRPTRHRPRRRLPSKRRPLPRRRAADDRAVDTRHDRAVARADGGRGDDTSAVGGHHRRQRRRRRAGARHDDHAPAPPEPAPAAPVVTTHHDDDDDRARRRRVAQLPDGVVRPISFPVLGPVRYGNDWGNCRDGCRRRHEGTDMIGVRMQPLLAAVDGTVTRIRYENEGTAGSRDHHHRR